MRRAAAAAASLAVVSATSVSAAGRATSCSPPRASAAYTQSVRRALLSGRDLWGNRLIAAPAGPTFATASHYLAPLLFAVGADGRRVTTSGVYYLALALPRSPYVSRGFALHVADGSEIVVRRAGGRRLTIFVGRNARERFGSCLARLGTPGLADGYLPVLETSYADGAGVRYEQESFAGRLPGSTSLVSFVRIAADGAASTTGAAIRVAGPGGTVRARVPARGRVDLYAAWSQPRGASPETVTAAVYGRARAATVRFWRGQLARGVVYDVPEPRVVEAERSLLTQAISMTWRYSVGNTYEELSFAEALSAAETMAEYGHADVAKAILRFALRRLPVRYTSRRAGELLAASAVYYRLVRDRAFLREETGELTQAVERLAGQIERPGGNGLVEPEAISTDIGTKIYGLHEQTAVWEGLLTMGAVWAETGQPALAARCRSLARRLGTALRRAVTQSEQRLADGSLFVPLALLDHGRPFARIAATRDGTYWNLLVPYALASGFLPPHGAEARGLLRYLLDHGSRLLGLVRGADARIYGRLVFPVSGTNAVYNFSVSRFLADNDQPDQLILSLYGMLAAALTPGTFVAGEGASVFPLHGELGRAMLLPPNSGAAAAFLETLRLLLVHETPTGLELAYSTPRAWLAGGKTIRVSRAPTSFGPVSYSLHRLRNEVVAALDVPARVPQLRLRLRLPAGTCIASVRLAGRRLPFDATTGTIDLSGRSGRFELRAATSAGPPSGTGCACRSPCRS